MTSCVETMTCRVFVFSTEAFPIQLCSVTFSICPFAMETGETQKEYMKIDLFRQLKLLLLWK